MLFCRLGQGKMTCSCHMMSKPEKCYLVPSLDLMLVFILYSDARKFMYITKSMMEQTRENFIDLPGRYEKII